MVSYDYGQLPQQNAAYQPPYSTLPPQQFIDSTHQYSVAPPFITQQPLPPSHYPPMMMYPPKQETNLLPHAPSALPMQPVSYPMGTTGGIISTHILS
jgi:hypothetical protein